MQEKGLKKVDAWACRDCGSVLIYEVRKGKARLTSINKQKAQTSFLILEATCKKCGLKQEIRSQNLLKIYNIAFNDGMRLARKLAHEDHPDIPLHETDLNWKRSRLVEDKILKALDEEEIQS